MQLGLQERSKSGLFNLFLLFIAREGVDLFSTDARAKQQEILDIVGDR